MLRNSLAISVLPRRYEPVEVYLIGGNKNMRKPQYERRAFLIQRVKSIFWRLQKAIKQLSIFAELALYSRL